MPPRRSHRKSRRGCAECKARHIKCDETTPRCINCVTAAKACSFEKNAKAANKPAPPPAQRSGPATPSTISSQTLAPTPTNSTSTFPSPNLNLDHLQLLHHYYTRTSATFSNSSAQQDVWRDQAVRHGLKHRFLIYELLALTSLHLASEGSDMSQHYVDQATALQNVAMSEFSAMKEGVTQENCPAVLLFSSLLAMHVLADPTRTTGLDLHGYIDHLLRCINLMRSVRYLVINDWLEYLRTDSDIRPILAVDSAKQPYSLPQAVSNLVNLTKNSELSDEAVKGYSEAIERLHWLYASSEVPDQTYDNARWILGWPLQLRDEYLDLLNKRRPEALVILCYYAAALHCYRNCWVVGDVGSYLIKAICAHLGRYWADWLKWPKELIAAEFTP